MTYLLLDLAFLAVVALVALAAILSRGAPRWRAVGLAAIPLVVLTIVFDNVLVGLGIVAYDPALISGIRMPIAPVEDLSYTIAAVVLLPSLWILLARPRTVAAVARGGDSDDTPSLRNRRAGDSGNPLRPTPDAGAEPGGRSAGGRP